MADTAIEMSTELQTLQAGLAHYQARRYQEAEQLYCSVLEQNPRNPDALHLLGLLYLDCGQPQPAAGLISKAIQQRPDVPFFYNTLGNAFRGLGKREQALLCFRKAIGLKPDYGEAFTNLGSALEESGQAGEAIAFHQRAADLQPGRAEVYGNLGNAFRSAGRPEEARAAYAIALRLRPDYAEAWMNLGNIYFDREEYRQAERHYRQALGHNPRLASAQANLGSVLNERGRFKEAEEWCSKALEAQPGDALAHSNLASILLVTGRAELAEQHCRRALEIDPGLPEGHANLGLALGRMHRLDEAEQQCRESVRLRPHAPSGHVHLAGILLLMGRFAESEDCLRQSLDLCPNQVRAVGCLGDVRAAQCDLAGALQWYEKAIGRAPEGGLLRFARARVWLTMGDYERGWEEYEFRFRLGECQAMEFSQPAWDGSPFPGRTVLLHTEQGLGDTIQFVRFVPLVKRLGGNVVLACQPALLPILSDVEGVDRVVANVCDAPAFDYDLPLLSVPRVLGTREHDIPRQVPYLRVPVASAVIARKRLAGLCGEPDGRLRVGIAWAGSSKNPDDINRSMRLEQLEPLLRLPGVQFLSLQQGMALPPRCSLISIVADSDPITTTAALLDQLDLILAVDTMIAHLAGALGCPVWTLLRFAADWRWLAGREDSPWYPTMRLYRQPRFGAWQDVVQEVCRDLSKQVNEPKVLG